MGDGDDDEKPISIGRASFEIVGNHYDGCDVYAPSPERIDTRRHRQDVRGGSGGRRGGSGIGDGGGRRRGGGGHRGRHTALYPRHRRGLRVDELVGLLIKIHGLTDEVRLRCVHMYWRRIVGVRIGARTTPDSLSDGVLTVFVESSVWMHELQFVRATMIEQINSWIGANRRWLGPPPFVSDIRFVLGRPREPLVDPEHLRRLVERTLRQRRPPDLEPPEPPSASERNMIFAETSVIEDPALRAMIEGVRTRWNR